MVDQIGRRRFLAGAGALVVARRFATAQSSPMVRVVGSVGLPDAESAAPIHEALQTSLRKLGWVEGQNLRFENRWVAGQFDKLKKAAAELVHLPVDVIIPSSNIATGVVRQITGTIPVVMLIGADPVSAGFAASLAKPGGNVTGVSFDPTPQIFEKHLQMLKELAPATVRVIVIRNPSLPGGKTYWHATSVAAEKLGLALHQLAVESAADMQLALSALSKKLGDAVFIFGDPVTFSASRQIAEVSLKNHLPVISVLRQYAVTGGLASYGPDFLDLARHAAVYVDKILRGANPADLPIEQPTKFELVLNLKTAKSLGLTVPQSVLLQADQVVE